MLLRATSIVLLALTCTSSALALPRKHHDSRSAPKIDRHDPAFRAGYDAGYRAGADDSEYNSNSYNDEGGPVYDQASDGYTRQYGDKAKYQKLFRLGYVTGYKDGWDFNAGRYPTFGTPDPGL